MEKQTYKQKLATKHNFTKSVKKVENIIGIIDKLHLSMIRLIEVTKRKSIEADLSVDKLIESEKIIIELGIDIAKIKAKFKDHKEDKSMDIMETLLEINELSIMEKLSEVSEHLIN